MIPHLKSKMKEAELPKNKMLHRGNNGLIFFYSKCGEAKNCF